MLSKTHKRAILALIIANAIWGAASPIFKLSLQNIPPFTLAHLRFFGAAALLLPFAINKLHVERKDWFSLFLFSFFGITLNISFFFLGLAYAPSINMPIIASSGPVFLYLISIFFLKEKMHPKMLTGTLVSLLGILVIVGQPLVEKGLDGSIIGNIFFVLATFGAVVHTIVGKKLLEQYRVTTITFWSFTIGALTFFPLFIWEAVTKHPFATLDNRGMLGILFGIFLSSFCAYILYDWGMKRIETQEVGIFTYIDPVVAALIALPLLGEVITPIFIGGSILVFVGIFICEGRLHYHPFHKLH